MTPTQRRAAIVTVVRSLGYEVSSRLTEHGKLKAWLKPAGKPRNAAREAGRIARALARAGLELGVATRGYGGEYDVTAPTWRLIVNQEQDCSDYTGGVFVEVEGRRSR
jgi:hypothetical protein